MSYLQSDLNWSSSSLLLYSKFCQFLAPYIFFSVLSFQNACISALENECQQKDSSHILYDFPNWRLPTHAYSMLKKSALSLSRLWQFHSLIEKCTIPFTRSDIIRNISYTELRIWNQVNCDSLLDFKSAVQYMKYFINHFTSIPHGLIRNHKWQAPNISGFIPQLVRALTGITRSRVQTPLNPDFFRLLYAIAYITAMIIAYLIIPFYRPLS